MANERNQSQKIYKYQRFPFFFWRISMTTDILMKKIEHIEELLMALNGKIDNFLGFEDMSEEEKDEVEKIRKEIRAGEYHSFDDVFED